MQVSLADELQVNLNNLETGWNELQIEYKDNTVDVIPIIRPLEYDSCNLGNILVSIDPKREYPYEIRVSNKDSKEAYLSFPVAYTNYIQRINFIENEEDSSSVYIDWETFKLTPPPLTFPINDTSSPKIFILSEGKEYPILRKTNGDSIIMDTNTNNKEDADKKILMYGGYPVIFLRGLTFEFPQNINSSIIDVKLDQPRFIEKTRPLFFPFYKEKIYFSFYSSCDYTLNSFYYEMDDNFGSSQLVSKDYIFYISNKEKDPQNYTLVEEGSKLSKISQNINVKEGETLYFKTEHKISLVLSLLIFFFPIIVLFFFLLINKKYKNKNTATLLIVTWLGLEGIIHLALYPYFRLDQYMITFVDIISFVSFLIVFLYYLIKK